MQRVLLALEKQPVGILELRRAAPLWCRVMKYDDLPAKPQLKLVLGKRYKCVICLYQMHDAKHRVSDGVGHYVCISRTLKGKVEYFSSYGMQPGVELSATHSDPDKLQSLVGSKPIISSARLQSRYHTNTCARWALLRAMLVQIPLKIFVKLMSGRLHLKTPDDLCALATLFVIR